MRRIVAASIGLLLGVTILLGLYAFRSPARVVKDDVAARPSGAQAAGGSSFQDQVSAPPPPKLTQAAPGDIPSVTTDPRSREYDPVKLSRLTNMSFSTAFDTEPRDPVFAPGREQMLKDTTAADLASVGAAARLQSVECKSATCKLTFVGKSPEETRWGSILMTYTAVANAIQPGKGYEKDGQFHSVVYVAYDAENRGHEAWTKAYTKQREAHLALHRSKPVPAGYPPPPPR